MKTIWAEIVTIGDELLIGQVIDTNSAWLGEQLSSLGIKVKQITSVSDDKAHILSTLADAGKRADVVLMTGGLGPTKDDITKHTLVEFFATTLVHNPRVEEHVRALFARYNRQPGDVNLQQAMLPANATVLHNAVGTAPGMWFNKEGIIYVSMPGVPYEMKSIAEYSLFPKLKEHFSLPTIIHATVLTQGMGESMIAEKIADWEDALPTNMKLAYLPSPGMVRLRISALGDDATQLQTEVDQQVKSLEAILGNLIYGYGKQTLAEVVGTILKSQNATVSVAESCTGGNVAHLLTLTPGSSAYFWGGIISYDDNVKVNKLGVNPDDIKRVGVVSEEVALQMAEGARQRLNSTWAIATTGIAGPTGERPNKPVGLIWIAIAGPNGAIAKQFKFDIGRERFITVASLTALNMLRLQLLQQ